VRDKNSKIVNCIISVAISASSSSSSSSSAVECLLYVSTAYGYYMGPWSDVSSAFTGTVK
jgi:hypothetical protein